MVPPPSSSSSAVIRNSLHRDRGLEGRAVELRGARLRGVIVFFFWFEGKGEEEVRVEKEKRRCAKKDGLRDLRFAASIEEKRFRLFEWLRGLWLLLAGLLSSIPVLQRCYSPSNPEKNKLDAKRNRERRAKKKKAKQPRRRSTSMQSGKKSCLCLSLSLQFGTCDAASASTARKTERNFIRAGERRTRTSEVAGKSEPNFYK